MRISEREVSEVVVLDLRGRITLRTGGEFREKLNELQGRRVPRVLLNMEGITYIDSAGLGELVLAHKRNRAGVRYKFLAFRGQPLKQIRFTKLVTVFETFENEAEALASFRPAA